MNRSFLLLGLLAVVSGCGSSDIVSTKALELLDERCVHIETIQSQDPFVGRVLSDIFQKEFIRHKVALCDPDSATIIVTGSTFMTVRSAGSAGRLKSRKSAAANEAIESISLTARDQNGQILLTASYDNKKLQTAGTLAREFGRAVAIKLR